MTLTLTFLMVLIISVYMYTPIDARQTAQRRARGHARAPAPPVDARERSLDMARRAWTGLARRARAWTVEYASHGDGSLGAHDGFRRRVDGASRAIDGDGERPGVIRSSRFARARRFRSLGARDDIEVRGDGARAQGGGAERGERRGVG